MHCGNCGCHGNSRSKPGMMVKPLMDGHTDQGRNDVATDQVPWLS
jgi:hypothetical protein